MATATMEPKPPAAKPPGPPNRFNIVSGREPQKDLLGFFNRCGRQFGDLCYIPFYGLPTVFINSPELIESVLVTNYHKFRKSRDYRSLKLILGNGLLISDGDFWRRQRKLAQPAFHRERIAAYGEVMLGCGKRMLDSWRSGETIDVHEHMMRMALDIVAQCLFQADVSHLSGMVGTALDLAMRAHVKRAKTGFLMPDWWPSPLIWRYRKAIGKLDGLIDELVELRRGQAGSGSLIDMFLAARDDEGLPMSRQQLRDEVKTLFLAGHETSANALSWTFYLLARNPGAESALHAELDRVLGGRWPTFGDVPELRYTAMIVKEALRLYPPVWGMSREAKEPFELGGYGFEKNTYVMISQYVTHRDPRFFPDPERFFPERWNEETSARVPRFAYFPFGAGPRVCIGAAFANLEMVLALAAIAQRFRLRLDPTHRVVPFPSVTLRPKYGIRMSIEGR